MFFNKWVIVCFVKLLVGGKVFTWGRGTSGQLGHGDMVNTLYPKVVSSLGDYFITHVSAGWNHSGFVSGLFIFHLRIFNFLLSLKIGF